jgi:hypothetical protein
VLYTFQVHTLLPAVPTWPIQRQIVIAKDMMRHELWPWTIKVDKAKDSERHPFSRHIVAVGDLHGDLPNARRVLDFSGVVDEFGDWSGDVDVFVQTGDIIDRCVERFPTILHLTDMNYFRGDDTIPLFAWMDRLRSQAAHAGGVVLSHLGNHEWMNAIGASLLGSLSFDLILIFHVGDWR